jgi:hypothetical protein
MMTDQSSPYYERPRAGFGRGIEFYRGLQFFHVLAGSIGSYASGVGTWPDLLQPVLFTEKLLWTKFFQFIPVPAPADRLAMRSFIPQELRDEIKTAKILWQSSEPICPPDSAVPPGQHYVKFSHRSGISRRLQFPLSPQETSMLQHWLHTAFGSPQVPIDGQWWFGAIKPAVFVEEAVGGAERRRNGSSSSPTASVRFLYHERQRPSGTRCRRSTTGRSTTFRSRSPISRSAKVVEPPDEHERMLTCLQNPSALRWILPASASIGPKKGKYIWGKLRFAQIMPFIVSRTRSSTVRSDSIGYCGRPDSSRLCTTTIRCGKVFIASQRILNFRGCAFSVPPLNQQRGGFGMFAVVVGYAEKLKRNSVRMRARRPQSQDGAPGQVSAQPGFDRRGSGNSHS